MSKECVVCEIITLLFFFAGVLEFEYLDIERNVLERTAGKKQRIQMHQKICVQIMW
jgi:hypothetical protein